MKRLFALLVVAIVGFGALRLAAQERRLSPTLKFQASLTSPDNTTPDPELEALRKQYVEIQKDLANGLNADELRARIEAASKESREVWVKARLATIVEQLEKLKQDFPETDGAATAQAAIDVITVGARGHGHDHLDGHVLPPSRVPTLNIDPVQELPERAR